MNPGSRGGESSKKFETIHNYLKHREINYDFAITRNLDDAYNLSTQANNQDCDVIVAVGGDGTINRTLNGFYNNEGKRTSKAEFGIVYTGTSPDFCKSYNIPLDLIKAMEVLIEGKAREIGIGRVQFEDKIKYFACCANIGLGAALARNANSGIRNVLGDGPGTFLALIRTLFTYKPIDITLNGHELKKVFNVSIGKTYYVASGMKIKNELKPIDDRFYILTVQNKLFKFITKLYTGGSINLDYADRIEISGLGEVEFDGDEAGILPCVITPAERICILN